MEQKTITVELTPEEQQALQEMRRERAAKEAAAKAKADRDAYKALGEELVSKHVPLLMELSRKMSEVKAAVYRDFETLIESKSELYGVKQGQRTHAWRNADSTMRLTLGYHSRDSWDETVEDGIAMVKQYISSLASNDETAALVNIILDLLAKDSQGNLQAEKVLQLDKYASESQSPSFLEGVQIIKDAYRPEKTKQFIRAEIKNKQNAWETIPLGVTEVGNVNVNNEKNDKNND